jgi:lysophospholipase L1-like esterase
MTSRRARRGAAIATLCLGSLMVTSCGPFSGQAGSEKTAAVAPSPTRSAVPEAPLVMFLGDSYTVGGGSPLESTYASAAARLLGWQVIIAGRGGTGFVIGGRTQTPFAVMFESQLGWRPAPDLLIIAGGHNDRQQPPQQVGTAARDLLNKARQRWPGTRIAVIGPFWGNENPQPGVLAVRDALRGVSGQFGVPFIDPIGERWITGNRASGTGNAPGYIRPDGVHPTIEGHRYLATRLGDDLRRLRLASPSRTTA